MTGARARHHKRTNKRHHKKPRRVTSGNVRRADVAVVGAGLSGIAATNALLKAGKSVVLLEAGDRVGGRTFATQLEPWDWYVEHGGVFIVDQEKEHQLLSLADEVGVGRIITPSRKGLGDNMYYRNGHLVKYDPTGPAGRVPAPTLTIPELLSFSTKLDQMVATVPPAHPWDAPNAQEWDGKTFDTFLREELKQEDSRWVVNTMAKFMTGNEARDYSLLYLLAFVAGSEGLTSQQGINQPGLYRFADGGSYQISYRHAQRWPEIIVFNSPVRRIEQDSSSVTVISDQVTVNAGRVVVALPPFLGTRIRWDPQLPAQRAQAIERIPNATIFRLNFVYDKPFWFDNGLTGECWTDEEPFLFTWDISPPDHRCGMLTAFITGATSRKWIRIDPQVRKQAVMDQLVRYFGPQGADVKQYYEKGWAFTEWTAGCQFGVYPPGVFTGFGASLRPPFGRVHWGGCEIANGWADSMEGAVRSGEEAARQAIEAG